MIGEGIPVTVGRHSIGQQRQHPHHGVSSDRDHVALGGAQARRPRVRDVRSGQSRNAQRGLTGEIQRKQPALVGSVSSAPPVIPYAKILARDIRAANRTVKLAFGGVFASLNAPLVKQQFPEVDFVCRGNGEQLILDILEHMDDPAGVEGVTWAKDGQVVSNPNRRMERNLDQWPFPDRESLKLDFVESMPLDVPCVLSLERFTTMQTSRGACVFCDIPVFNEGKWRSRTPHSTSWTSSSISSDLFACRWLRASKKNDEGLADAVSEAHGHAGRGREEP